jgi:hypothetical protein
VVVVNVKTEVGALLAEGASATLQGFERLALNARKGVSERRPLLSGGGVWTPPVGRPRDPASPVALVVVPPPMLSHRAPP